jgi:large subunit ribosomal protein L25
MIFLGGICRPFPKPFTNAILEHIMSTTFEFKAEARSTHGKAHARRMRRNDDTIPAIVYGAGKDPQSITMVHNDVIVGLKNEAVYSHILTLDIAGKQEKVVLKALQRHPYKDRIMHMDFLRINAKDKITMTVPLHYLNEEEAPGFKEGGVISHLINEIEIRCLPANLPEFIEVDAATLAADSSLHLSDIPLPKGLELTVEITEDNNQPIISIHKPRAEKEESDDADADTAAEGDAAKSDADKKSEG